MQTNKNAVNWIKPNHLKPIPITFKGSATEIKLLINVAGYIITCQIGNILYLDTKCCIEADTI